MTAVAPDVAAAGVISNVRRSLSRVAGMSGLAFVALVAAENVLIGSASPPANDASAAEIADFFSGNKTLISVAVAMVPVAVVALFLFIAGITERLRRGATETLIWTRVGMTGLMTAGPLFLTGLLFEYVLIAQSSDLEARGALTETLWQLRGGSLLLTGIALGIGMIGLSRSARLNGLISSPHQGLGFVAAGGFLVTAMFAARAVEGSPVGLVAFVAFAGWLIWLTWTSLRLLRSAD